ncbi:MAG: four-carbon acid sugar kinase family protein [Pseudomonadota bacterium]
MSQVLHFKVAILADDLTSAADAASPFIAHGLTVHIGRQHVPSENADVCAIDLASRSASVTDAAVRVENCAREMRSAPVVLKTVDSTLRGHVREEITAALRGSQRQRLVFAPAFPNAGRTTVNGIQLVDGVPVHLSAYGKDPVHPARFSKLQELLPNEAINTVVLDAGTQDDLDQQVAEIERPEDVLWVGSPGLARALAKRFGAKKPACRQSFDCEGAVLVVVGSANQVSHRQAAAIEGNAAKLLIVPAGRHADPKTVLERLVDDAVGQLATGTFGAVIATGGDTMEAILDRTGTLTFNLLGEIEPGFPIGSAETGGGVVLLGMKAGGFGDDATLKRAVHRLSKQTKELTL